MSNILFKRGAQATLNTLKTNNQGIDGAFYLTEDTHRLYAGIGNKIVDLNKYITVVNTESELNTLNPQNGDFAYIASGNILAVYTTGPVKKPDNTVEQQTKWFQINVNTDTTYTVTATGDNATDPGTLNLNLVDDNDKVASTAKVKFIGTKGADVTVGTDGTVTVEGNVYTLVKDFGTVDGDGYVTKMDVTLTPEDIEAGVEATKFNITAGKNIEFKKNADGHGITIEGTDAADFEDDDCSLNVNGADATLTLALKNGSTVVVKAEDAFKLNYGKNGDQTVDNQGTMSVYTKDEVDDLVTGLNAMTYVGPVPTGGLPTSGVSIGDTYMATSALDFYLGTGNVVSFTEQTGYIEHTAKIGDLFIATSSDKKENASGEIDAAKLVWTYIPSGDDSQTDTTYHCTINESTKTFTIYNSNEQAIGSIKVADDGMVKVTATKGSNGNVGAPWELSFEHAEVERTDATDGDNGATSVIGISAIETDDYGHITKVTTKTTNLAGYKITGATATVASNAATITHTVMNSNEDPASVTTATMGIAANADDNLVLVKNGENGIKISMEWGTF